MFRIRRVGSWSDHEIRVQMKFMQRIAKKGKRDEKLGIEGLGKSGKSSSHLDFSFILDMMVCLKIEDSILHVLCLTPEDACTCTCTCTCILAPV